jgi:hypothetical protein
MALKQGQSNAPPEYCSSDTYKVSDFTLLLKFRSGKLAHVFPCSVIRNVGSAAHNLPPQGQYALPLYELHDHEHDSHSAKGKLFDKPTWSRLTGLFPRDPNRDGGLGATVAYRRSIPAVWRRKDKKTVIAIEIDGNMD